MEPRLLRILLLRGALMALPFVVWFAWRAWARSRGREPGDTPWPWLVGVGAVLVGLSILLTAFLHPDNRGQVYVPGEMGADGRVQPGRYEPR